MVQKPTELADRRRGRAGAATGEGDAEIGTRQRRLELPLRKGLQIWGDAGVPETGIDLPVPCASTQSRDTATADGTSAQANDNQTMETKPATRMTSPPKNLRISISIPMNV